VPGVLGQDVPKVALAEDEHPVGELGTGGEHEPFGVGVHARTAGGDLEDLDARVGQDRIERGGELAGPIPDEESERLRASAEVEEVAVWGATS
jgi:hypothetical protein